MYPQFIAHLSDRVRPGILDSSGKLNVPRMLLIVTIPVLYMQSALQFLSPERIKPQLRDTESAAQLLWLLEKLHGFWLVASVGCGIASVVLAVVMLKIVFDARKNASGA